jgi:hypothetical protein
MEDAFDLWEMVQVNRYNEYRAAEYARERGK